MSAMKIKAPEGPLTVKSLREYLDAMENAWTEEDSKYMGDFETQVINTMHENGIGRSKIVYDGGLDFIILPQD